MSNEAGRAAQTRLVENDSANSPSARTSGLKKNLGLAVLIMCCLTVFIHQALNPESISITGIC